MSKLSLNDMSVEELEQAKLEAMARFDERIKEKLNEKEKFKMELQKAMEQPSYKASVAWCKITNALIRKYKTMAEENPEECVSQLTKLEGFLVGNGYLSEQELNEAL